MFRARIETLERRTMFAVNPLADLSTTLEEQPATSEHATVEQEPTESFSLNFEAIKVEVVARRGAEKFGDGGYNHGDIRGLVGDFNGDGTDDLAAAGPSNLIIVVCARAPEESLLLPYIEQGDFYRSGQAITDVTDGMSNTLVFDELAASVPPVDINLLGALVDTSPIELSVVSADTWEHAYSIQDGRATNGGRASQVTHDAEFEMWANARNFDRGYLSPALEDVLVSSILHEDNEFSFPRMFTGGVRVG
jgi:hypothetical protein